jgi:hypothetical protein
MYNIGDRVVWNGHAATVMRVFEGNISELDVIQIMRDDVDYFHAGQFETVNQESLVALA